MRMPSSLIFAVIMAEVPETVADHGRYLLRPETHINDIYLREGDLTKQFWTNSIADSRRIGDKVSVYVLTDKKTASGGEELAYDLQQLKRAAFVASLRGAARFRAARSDCRIISEFSSTMAINPITKTNWEEVGVQPDVAVPGDQALTKAIELIRAKAK